MDWNRRWDETEWNGGTKKVPKWAKRRKGKERGVKKRGKGKEATQRTPERAMHFYRSFLLLYSLFFEFYLLGHFSVLASNPKICI